MHCFSRLPMWRLTTIFTITKIQITVRGIRSLLFTSQVGSWVYSFLRTKIQDCSNVWSKVITIGNSILICFTGYISALAVTWLVSTLSKVVTRLSDQNTTTDGLRLRCRTKCTSGRPTRLRKNLHDKRLPG